MKKSESKKIDNKIKKLLREKGVLTRKELEQKMNYKGLDGRLKKLVRNGEINVAILNGKKHYYLDLEGYKKWMDTRIKEAPVRLRPALRRKLRAAIGNIRFYHAVRINEELYNRIKREAERRNIPMKVLAEEILESVLNLVEGGRNG